MDLFIPLGVLLLVVAVVALLLAKLGKARQTERTAQLYGAKSTYQPTYEDPSARPGVFSGSGAFPGTTAAPASAPGLADTAGSAGGTGASDPADAEIQDAMETMADNLAELLKKKGAGKGTFETTVTTTTTSTSHPMTRTTTHHADPGNTSPATSSSASAAGPAGTHYTERSISLTEETAGRVKALAVAGKRDDAVALLNRETGMDGQGADMMVDMILEQF